MTSRWHQTKPSDWLMPCGKSCSSALSSERKNHSDDGADCGADAWLLKTSNHSPIHHHKIVSSIIHHLSLCHGNHLGTMFSTNWQPFIGREHCLPFGGWSLVKMFSNLWSNHFMSKQFCRLLSVWCDVPSTCSKLHDFCDLPHCCNAANCKTFVICRMIATVWKIIKLLQFAAKLWLCGKLWKFCDLSHCTIVTVWQIAKVLQFATRHDRWFPCDMEWNFGRLIISAGISGCVNSPKIWLMVRLLWAI